MDPRYKLYTEFTRAFVSAYADLKQEIAYRQAQQEWTKICKKPLKDIEHCIQTWHAKSAKKKGSLLTLWARAAEKNVVSDDTLSYSATQSSSNAEIFTYHASFQ